MLIFFLLLFLQWKKKFIKLSKNAWGCSQGEGVSSRCLPLEVDLVPDGTFSSQDNDLLLLWEWGQIGSHWLSTVRSPICPVQNTYKYFWLCTRKKNKSRATLFFLSSNQLSLWDFSFLRFCAFMFMRKKIQNGKIINSLGSFYFYYLHKIINAIKVEDNSRRAHIHSYITQTHTAYLTMT